MNDDAAWSVQKKTSVHSSALYERSSNLLRHIAIDTPSMPSGLLARFASNSPGIWSWFFFVRFLCALKREWTWSYAEGWCRNDGHLAPAGLGRCFLARYHFNARVLSCCVVPLVRYFSLTCAMNSQEFSQSCYRVVIRCLADRTVRLSTYSLPA